MLTSLINDADSNLMDALGYVNMVKLAVGALGSVTRGAEMDDALHSLTLASHEAVKLINAARQQLADMDQLVPADNPNNGEDGR